MAEDGNVQEMSVHDKDFPSLGATYEEQDMSRLAKVIVPMPQFDNPGDPSTSSGSVNLSLAQHPAEHAGDYGGNVDLGLDDVRKPQDAHATEQMDDLDGEPGARERQAAMPTVEYPENREEWAKKHWQSRARELDLPVSGNMDTVKDRVEEYEGQVEAVKGWNATEWKTEIDSTETQDDLDELRALYGRSGASFSTVDSAFDSRSSELASEQ